MPPVLSVQKSKLCDVHLKLPHYLVVKYPGYRFIKEVLFEFFRFYSLTKALLEILWTIVMVMSMSRTTVEVKKSTLQALEELKAELGTHSLDEAIQTLIRQIRKVPKSKFGVHPDMTPFTPKDEGRSHEL